MMNRKNWFSEWLAGLRGKTASIILAGFALWLLAQTFFGNWLRCNFVDSTGCLARLQMEITPKPVLDCNYLIPTGAFAVQSSGKPPEFEPSTRTCTQYSIAIENRSYRGTGKTTLKIAPLVGTENKNTHVLKHWATTGPPDRGPVVSQDGRTLELFSYHFEAHKGFSFSVTERAIFGFLVAYPKDLYDAAGVRKLHIELDCPNCQKRFEFAEVRQ